MVNDVTLVGNLGHQPEVRFTNQGKAVCTLSVATTKLFNGEKQTTWHDVTCWGALAERVGTYMKGQQVYVSGSLTNRKVTSKKAPGFEYWKTEVTAWQVFRLGPADQPNAQPQQEEDSGELGPPISFDDDLPPLSPGD